MRNVHAACEDLATGTARQRLRAWQRLPELLREADARARRRARPNTSRIRLVLAEDCLRFLKTPQVTDWVASQSGEEWQLTWIRQWLSRLMVRHALQTQIAEAEFRDLVRVLGSEKDPFEHARPWTEVFTPGRLSVPVAEAPKANQAVYLTGLQQCDSGFVRAHRPLIIFLWYARLREAIESGLERDRIEAFVQQIALAPAWRSVLLLLAERLEGESLNRLLSAIIDLNGSASHTRYRLTLAGLCLGRVQVGRRSMVDYATANVVATRLVDFAIRDIDAHLDPKSQRVRRLVFALRGAAPWVPSEDSLRDQWFNNFSRDLFGSEMTRRGTLVRVAPDLFSTYTRLTAIANWIETGTDIRHDGFEHLGGDRYDFDADLVLHPPSAALGWFELLGAAALHEPLLIRLLNALQGRYGQTATERALRAALSLRASEIGLWALEGVLLNLGQSHDTHLRAAALRAALSLGSTNAAVLDWSHDSFPSYSFPTDEGEDSFLLDDEMFSHALRRKGDDSRRITLTTQQHSALAARLLTRLNDPTPQGRLAVLRTFRNGSSGVSALVLSRITELLRDCDQEVAAAAVDALLVLSGDPERQFLHLQTIIEGSPQAVRVHFCNGMLRAINNDRWGEHAAVSDDCLVWLLSDESENVRSLAKRIVCRLPQRLASPSFLGAVDRGLRNQGSTLLLSISDLWMKVASSAVNEPLARLLLSHGPESWRLTLARALGLDSPFDENSLWLALAERLFQSGIVPGESVAWETVSGEPPAEVWALIAECSVHQDYQRRLSAGIALTRLREATGLGQLFTVLIKRLDCEDASVREWALEALRKVGLPAASDEAFLKHLDEIVRARANKPELFQVAVEAFAAIGASHIGIQRVAGIIQILGRTLPPQLQFRLSCIDKLLKTLKPGHTDEVAQVACAMSKTCEPSVKCRVIQYALAPLVGLGNATAAQCLVSHHTNEDEHPEVREFIQRELNKLVHLLTNEQLVALLNTSGDELDELPARAARELRGTTPHRSPQSYSDLWRDLAVGTGSPTVRREAFLALARMPNTWPFTPPETARYVRGRHGNHLREAVVAILPRIFPDGIPPVVVEALPADRDNWFALPAVVNQLESSARQAFARDLIKVARESDSEETCRQVFAVVRGGEFEAVPREIFRPVWSLLYHTSSAVRRAAAGFILALELGWLANCTDTDLAPIDTPTNGSSDVDALTATGGKLPRWLLDELTCAMRAGGFAGWTVLRLVRRFGADADCPALIRALAGVHDSTLQPYASKCLAALDYVLDHSGTPIRAASFFGTRFCASPEHRPNGDSLGIVEK